MKVFIANFGRENYEWPVCQTRGTIATMNEVSAQAYWESGDREGYILSRMKGKTAAGITPTKPVASRWFNLMSIIAQSSGDIWIHREKDQFWWTTSRADPPMFEPKVEPVGDKRNVIVCHKPCNPWSDKNRNGNRLDWNGLHPKAREFLFTEGTLQQLGDDNAEYALALIEGADLSSWHSLPAWKAKAEKAREKRGVVTIFNAKQRAAARMAMTARDTVAGANGQQVLRTLKNKELKFASPQELERYLIDLLDLQEGLCAITGLTLQYDGEHEDAEMLCSLDRIDSEGHYEAGNLQVVCRFANRWKGSSSDEGFRRLIGAVRSVGSI
ncbi:hypothetical protein Nwi_0786 [Nitrobacter winogradskyi Nb-255]|uniref:Uncharacterized protein n=1 Tax=Nitrobacter winogradskyi (strain ATCC 25391 / DSM 10237 / CIP 104748 / NCIMB 11846 / Nb-255) TaxID=323098 RepID=Q3SUJ0_NITWN|nr:hypothetical protein [Nitrobacter winogradskyi]ABA04051.1 hypothetical protein Nwi_0786 [Nitrobacter winogradskyi Nb-255]